MLIGIGESAEVALKTRQINGELGFSVVAKIDLPEGVYVYQLFGMMAADSEAIHSRLSEIIPYTSQRKKGKHPRVLFGPARFINHDCCPNVEVSFSFCQFMYSDSKREPVHFSMGNICFCNPNKKAY